MRRIQRPGNANYTNTVYLFLHHNTFKKQQLIIKKNSHRQSVIIILCTAADTSPY